MPPLLVHMLAHVCSLKINLKNERVIIVLTLMAVGRVNAALVCMVILLE